MRRDLAGKVILASLVAAGPALAQEEGSEQELPRLGQSPGEPQVRSAPPSVPFGIEPKTSRENVLDFHGYLLVPLRLSVLERRDPTPGQSDIALHAPPIIPQRLRGFEYTGVIPDPWGQLDFIYGNSTVAGTAIIASRAVTDGESIYNPVDQLGVSDAFISVNLSDTFDTPFELKVGALTGRYGAMGAYDAGRYGTPLIARTNAIGESINAGFELGDLTLVVEQGIGGQLGRPPDDAVPAGWNDFADTEVASSWINHIHAGLAYAGVAQLGLHYLTAWSQDDSVGDGQVLDGRITVLGADARLTAGRGGHLYLGAAQTTATNAASVSGIIEVLNARGGPELMREYLGPDSGGDGSLTTFGAQYDLSVARLVYGEKYKGVSPDLLVSAFGIGTKVSSDDPEYDGVLKLKGGAELTYNMLSWFGVSGRYDHVRLDNENDREAFQIITSRLLFHTDWQSRDEFALQYSYFTYGGDVVVHTGYPPLPDPSVSPDRHVFVLSGTFWW